MTIGVLASMQCGEECQFFGRCGFVNGSDSMDEVESTDLHPISSQTGRHCFEPCRADPIEMNTQQIIKGLNLRMDRSY